MCLNPQRIKLDEPKYLYEPDKDTGELIERRLDYLDVSCGNCPDCKADVNRAWAFRMERELESTSTKTAFFVTLTYEKAPITPLGYMTLDYDDIKAFLKRLHRHNYKWHKANDTLIPKKICPDTGKPLGWKVPHKIKTFCVGEYGPVKFRPHWHLIIINAQSDHIENSWAKYIQPSPGQTMGHYESYGFVTIDLASIKRMRYILNYLNKPMYDTIVKTYPDFDGKREMRHMSNKIGYCYISDPSILRHHQDINNARVSLKNGENLPLPRYYKDKIYQDYEKEQIWKNAYLNKKQDQTEKLRKLGPVKYRKVVLAQNDQKKNRFKRKIKPRIPKFES